MGVTLNLLVRGTTCPQFVCHGMNHVKLHPTVAPLCEHGVLISSVPHYLFVFFIVMFFFFFLKTGFSNSFVNLASPQADALLRYLGTPHRLNAIEQHTSHLPLSYESIYYCLWSICRDMQRLICVVNSTKQLV
ncbi:unnamed protein product [Boreogadus saida]